MYFVFQSILSEKPSDELNNQPKEEIPAESLQSPVDRVTSTIPTTLPPPPVSQLPPPELKPTVLQQNPLPVVQQTQQQPQTLPEILTQQRSQTPQTQIHQHVIQRRLPSQQQQLQIQHQMHQQVRSNIHRVFFSTILVEYPGQFQIITNTKNIPFCLDFFVTQWMLTYI